MITEMGYPGKIQANALAGGPIPGGPGDGVWNRDAVVAERGGFDCSKGHPAMGNYHDHQNPSAFKLDLNVLSTICNLYDADGLYAIDSTQHSPLIGFAYDGFPIYGAYAYKNSNGTGGIVRMKSSYVKRNITTRTTYANGSTVTAGPAVSSTYPLGYFREDYEYIPTTTATPDFLDEHNGRLLWPKRKNEMVALPVSGINSSYGDQDADVEKDASLVLTLTADNKLYQRQSRDVNGKVERTETVITKDELPGKIKSAMEGKTPEKRVAYFKCDINATDENILPIFQALRNADVDRVGLVVVGKKDNDDPYQTRPISFPVILQEPFDTKVVMKPNPLMLVAAVDKDGKLSLNNEPKGTTPWKALTP